MLSHLPDGGGGGGGGGGDVSAEGGACWDVGCGCRSGGGSGDDSAGNGGGCAGGVGPDGDDGDGSTGPGDCAGDGVVGWTPCSQLKPCMCLRRTQLHNQQPAAACLVAVESRACAGDVLFCLAGTGPGGVEGKFEAATAAADGVSKSTWSSGMPNGMGSAKRERLCHDALCSVMLIIAIATPGPWPDAACAV